MDYLKIAALTGVFVVGTLAFAVLARNIHVWWMERMDRKRYYKNIARDAVRYAEDLYSGKVDRP